MYDLKTMSNNPNFSDRLTEKRDRCQAIITPLLQSRPSSGIKTRQSFIIRYAEYINALMCLRKQLTSVDLSSGAFFCRLFSMCFPALCFVYSSYLLFPTWLLGSTMPNFVRGHGGEPCSSSALGLQKCMFFAFLQYAVFYD